MEQYQSKRVKIAENRANQGSELEDGAKKFPICGD